MTRPARSRRELKAMTYRIADDIQTEALKLVEAGMALDVAVLIAMSDIAAAIDAKKS